MLNIWVVVLPAPAIEMLAPQRCAFPTVFVAERLSFDTNFSVSEIKGRLPARV